MGKIVKFTVLFLFFCNFFVNAYGIAIVDEGTANTIIIIDSNAPDTVRYAADELQNYIQQITGVKLIIKDEAQSGLNNIFVGKSKFTNELGLNTDDLKSDGFKIISGDNWIAILGRDYNGDPIFTPQSPFHYGQVYNEQLKLGAIGEMGTLYGVYRFLEDFCDVRWYMPGDLGTVITKQDSIKVDKINIEVSPKFEYRYTMLCDFAKSQTDARWYRRIGFGARYPVQIIHSFWFFLEKYKESHPEYFAIIGGQRDFSNLSTSTGQGNLCLSNPAVLKQWIADIDEYFDQNPNQFIFPLAPDDGMVKICECNDCRVQISPELGEGGIFSNYVWSFVNKVAQGVAVKHPDKFVGCFAYENFRKPPANIKSLNPNVAVMVCRPINPGSGAREKTEKLIAQWRQKTANNLYLYDYYLYSWKPWRNLPVAFPHLIDSDLKSVQEFCKGEFLEASSSEFAGPPETVQLPGMTHLNLYVTAKLLWNPNLDIDALLNEYYEKFYGPAQEYMKKFWTMAENIWIAKSPLGDPLKTYSTADLKQLSAYLEQAVSQTTADTIHRKRVELIQNEFLPGVRKLTNELIINPPQVKLNKATTDIKLDGLPDANTWQLLKPSGFVDTDGEPATFKTCGYAAWDANNLYVAFVNYEPQMDKLLALATQRDQNFGPGMWDEDSIEIFICPDSIKRDKEFQFIINAKGIIWDAMKENKSGQMDIKWNSQCEAKTTLESDRWTIKVKIPLRDIGVTLPADGKTIAVNFFRTRRCGTSYVFSSWSPTLIFQHDAPDRLGTIVFNKK